MDESRCGLRSVLHRRITLRGIKPVARTQQPRASLWRYGAADALTGDSYFRNFLRLCTANFQTFVDDLATAYPDEVHRMLLDHSGTHLAHALEVPSKMALHLLPPYSPELNPIERLWQPIKAPLAGQLPASLHELQEQLGTVIEALDEQTILSIITPYWLQAALHDAGLST